MKLRFYCDFALPLLGGHQFWATTNPCKRMEGIRRVAFDVVIPDNMIFQPDAEAPEVGKVEVVEDHIQEQTT